MRSPKHQTKPLASRAPQVPGPRWLGAFGLVLALASCGRAEPGAAASLPPGSPSSTVPAPPAAPTPPAAAEPAPVPTPAPAPTPPRVATPPPTTTAPTARAPCSGDAARACLRLDTPWRLVAVAGICATRAQADGDWTVLGALTVSDERREGAPRRGQIAAWRIDDGEPSARPLHTHDTVFWDARCADDGGLVTVGATRRRGVEEVVLEWWGADGVETRELGRWRVPFGHTAASELAAGAWGRPWGGFSPGAVWWRLAEPRKAGARLRSFVAMLPRADARLDGALAQVTALPVDQFLVGSSPGPRRRHQLFTVAPPGSAARLAVHDLSDGRGRAGAITASRDVPSWPKAADRGLAVAARRVGKRRKSAVSWVFGHPAGGVTAAQRFVDGRAVRQPVQASLADGRSLRAHGGAVDKEGGLTLWGSLGRGTADAGHASSPREAAVLRLRPSGFGARAEVLANAALGWTPALEQGMASVLATAAWRQVEQGVWAVAAPGGTRVDVWIRPGAGER